MLIDRYDLEVFTPPCEPGAERFSAIAHLSTDIREVFPYLNATLRGAIYEPAVPSVSWRKAGHYVTFQPNQIAISNVEDRETAIAEIEGIIRLTNRTWERRDQIEPNYETRRRPTGLELYKLLPRTNCKACGEASCFAFANKLAAGQVQLEACTPLGEPQYAAQREQLRQLLDVDLPAIGPQKKP
ncbi:MAG: (Fe-S)-binding protein [Anaerolineae bacterium]